MYKPDLTLSDRTCSGCGNQLYEDPHQNYVEAVMAAQEVYDDEEMDDFLDDIGDSIMEDDLCGKCCFNKWYYSRALQ